MGSLELGVSELYRCELDSEVLRLVKEFGQMVEWWVENGLKTPKKSYSEFRRAFYEKWRRRWEGWHSQHAQTSSMVAYKLLKLSTKHRISIPTVFKMPLAFLSPWTVKLENKILRVSIGERTYGYVKLFPDSKHQQKLLEQAEAGLWKIGQTTITPRWAIITFTTTLNLQEESKPELENLLS
jgi:hypothetical protein